MRKIKAHLEHKQVSNVLGAVRPVTRGRTAGATYTAAFIPHDGVPCLAALHQMHYAVLCKAERSCHQDTAFTAVLTVLSKASEERLYLARCAQGGPSRCGTAVNIATIYCFSVMIPHLGE